MPMFRVKSVKIYTGQKKIYTAAARGACDKYEVWLSKGLSGIEKDKSDAALATKNYFDIHCRGCVV